jgi:hypothetical protein
MSAPGAPDDRLPHSRRIPVSSEAERRARRPPERLPALSRELSVRVAAAPGSDESHQRTRRLAQVFCEANTRTALRLSRWLLDSDRDGAATIVDGSDRNVLDLLVCVAAGRGVNET